MAHLRRGTLYAVACVGGLATLAVELSAARLLGAVFGASNLVWANLIGLILLFLSVGYVVGGRLADRTPRPARLFQLAVGAGFLIALVPFAAPWVLRQAAAAVTQVEGGVVLGSLLSILVLFAGPVMLLGCLSPYALRLVLLDLEHAGRAAGTMNALGTVGSLIGTFLPVLFLIPRIGTARTFLGLSGLVMAVGVVGLACESRRQALTLASLPVLLGLMTWVCPPGTPHATAPDVVVLHEVESRYNYIQVAELTRQRGAFPAGTRLLLLNEGQGVHSIWPASSASGGPWRLFLAAPFFNTPPYRASEVRRVAIIGLAAGTLASHYRAALGPGVELDGVEIDPEILGVARRYFGLDELKVHAIADDGRLGLRRLDHLYDVIALDAYRPPYIPWHLATTEFFRELRGHLSPRGVVAANVVHGLSAESQSTALVEGIASSLRSAFPTVHAIDMPGSFNTLLVATVTPTPVGNLRSNLTTLSADAPKSLRLALEDAVEHSRPLDLPPGRPFTDDTSALESMVNDMLLRSRYSVTVNREREQWTPLH